MASGTRWALLHEVVGPEPELPDLLARMQPVDLVLVEGYKTHTFPKLEVHRPALGKPPIWPGAARYRGDCHRCAGQRRPHGTRLERSRDNCRLGPGTASWRLSRAHGRGTFRPAGSVRPVDPTIRPGGSLWFMRRIAFTCLCLALSGCGYNTWWNPPFTSGNNPNFPVGDSENMRRVTGEQVEVPPLTPEPGDIWPGPPPAGADAAGTRTAGPAGATGAAGTGVAGVSQPAAQPAATAGDARQLDAAGLQPAGPGCVADRRRRPPHDHDAAAPAIRPDRSTQTQQGPAVTSGGTSGYQTLTPRAVVRQSWCPMAMAPARSYIRTAGSRPSPHHVEVAMADAEAPLTILYFAWLRERTGTSQETVTLPAGVAHGRRPDRMAGRSAALAMPAPSPIAARCAAR